MRREPHEEALPSGRLMTVVGIALIVVGIGAVALPLTVPSSPGGRVGAGNAVSLVGTLVLTTVLGIGVVRMRLHVRIDDVLEVRVTPFWYRRRIPLNRIASATPMEMTALNSGGWGIRLIPSGTAILLDNGPGVHVTVDGKRALRFRCSDPDTVVAALEARGASVR
ncbi:MULTISPECIES: hypothetical protein [unclassified Curtobacterium]|uniref:hypothetical protein n=1 Tax=unclassified Curtobacterium TaxID=257496 RepID=UPI000D9F8F75|nr:MULTISPECIES: hypothetical protein [unclassified Curtobacterium]PYY32148.1 hypothetical protein DEI89_13965 [Curtobacterium sp. MCBD17_030]PZE34287.1 hypothetical protein DEJ31_15490 [Curtobacterium sp. MCPF17_031]